MFAFKPCAVSKFLESPHQDLKGVGWALQNMIKSLANRR